MAVFLGSIKVRCPLFLIRLIWCRSTNSSDYKIAIWVYVTALLSIHLGHPQASCVWSTLLKLCFWRCIFVSPFLNLPIWFLWISERTETSNSEDLIFLFYEIHSQNVLLYHAIMHGNIIYDLLFGVIMYRFQFKKWTVFFIFWNMPRDVRREIL